MLSDEYRVTAKRGLFAIVGDSRRGETFGDEILGVCKHHMQASAAQIIEVFPAQMEAAAES